MSTLRAVIVDDEALARRRTRSLLHGDPDVEIIAECTSVRDAADVVRSQAPDLLFLDLQASGLDDLVTLDEATAVRVPVIIFVTGYDQFALRALELYGLDYLLKPYDRSQFTRVLARAKTRLASDNLQALARRGIALVRDLRSYTRPIERVGIKSAGRVFFVRPDDIDWIDGAGNYARLHVKGQVHLLRERLKELETRLDPGQFLRIHRSTIVNIDRITELQHTSYREYAVLLSDGTRLTSSRSYCDRLYELLSPLRNADCGLRIG